MFRQTHARTRTNSLLVCFARLAVLVLPCVLAGAPQARADLAVPPADTLRAELARVGDARFTSSSYHPGTVRHIVLFRYKVGVTDAQKAEIRERFLALQDQCLHHGRPYILSIETGIQRSGEGADQGLEEGFLVTFRSEGDRNYYVGKPIVTDDRFYDPAHQAFKDFVGPFLHDTIGALVFDYYL